MVRLAAVALLAYSASIFAQTPPIHNGSTVFIKPMRGYEKYLAAALVKKKVPVIIVTDEARADFVILSTVSHEEARQPGIVINNRATANAGVNNAGNAEWNGGTNAGLGFPRRTAADHTDAGISVVGPKTSQIVFAYSSGSYSSNQTEKTAESFAKHFKKFIEKADRSKK